jgi:hypothetical protein
MKSLITYYLFAIILPVFILALLIQNEYKNTFVISLLFFALVYRPLLDGNRLIKKGVIKKREIWKLFVFYGHIKWFRELYFEK